MSRESAQNFFLRVAAMREAQKRYFETRTFADMHRAMKLENEIDGYIQKGMDFLDKEHQLQQHQYIIQFNE